MAGNISYDPSGTFTLGPGEEQKFFRAETRPGEDPWTVTEQTPEGWVLAGLECTQTGASIVTTDRATVRRTSRWPTATRSRARIRTR